MNATPPDSPSRSPLEELLRDTFDAHRAGAEPDDLTWQKVRRSGRGRQRRQIVVRLGAVLAAAALLVAAVATVRLLQTKQSEDGDTLNQAPAPATITGPMKTKTVASPSAR